MIPRPLLERHRNSRKIVEVGAGDRFETALEFAEACPDAHVIVTDVDGKVLDAPDPLVPVVDDILDPRWKVVQGADLLYGVRLPEELQRPVAELARRVEADYAVKPLGTEIVDLSDLKGTLQTVQGWDHVRWRT